MSLASPAGRTVLAAAATDARGMTKRGSARLPGRGDAGRAELAGTAAGQPASTPGAPLLARTFSHASTMRRLPISNDFTFGSGLALRSSPGGLAPG